MKKTLAVLLMAILVFGLLSCNENNAGKKNVVARVNDYDLTLEEFEYKLAEELDVDQSFKLNKESKRAYLDMLIQKELLIQEASRLKLDRDEKFARTIEKHWEATLILNLLELKGTEIDRRTQVLEEEALARYKEMKADAPDLPPFEEMREEITEELKESKKTKLLQEWINGLKKSARIQINPEAL